MQQKFSDGSNAIVKTGVFSGIDYIVVEKKKGNETLYKLFYDCECRDHRLALTREMKNSQGQATGWTAVTDTSGTPVFFDDITLTNLVKPREFLAITSEELDLLQQGITKSGKACCSNPNKSINKIIGYLRVF